MLPVSEITSVIQWALEQPEVYLVYFRSKVMRKLARRLDESGVVEEDDGTWGALVVIYAKPLPGKHDMSRVPVESMCVIPKTESGHLYIFLPHNYL